ncbi:MAG: hypothetical protein AAF633_10540 [Chloroflexota bacterium]
MVKGGHLLVSVINPVLTENPIHLDYHQRNREKGVPVGLVVIRMRYKEMVDEWVTLYMPTDDELDAAVAPSGWQVAQRIDEGPLRTILFKHE